MKVFKILKETFSLTNATVQNVPDLSKTKAKHARQSWKQDAQVFRMPKVIWSSKLSEEAHGHS